MHHALEIQEILLNIFYYCYGFGARRDASDLASLARTCRAFKEPALDVLWDTLHHLAPLAQCLPKASYRLFPHDDRCSFSRSLTQTEWDILHSYTRRIRRILNFRWGLDEKSLKIISNPPTTDPLFPNLRHLRCNYTTKSVHLLHFPFPSLVSLWVKFDNPHWFRDSFKSLPEFSPNITSLSVHVVQPDVAFDELVSECISQWQKLQSVVCPGLFLDMDALGHLSSTPSLTRLDFALSAVSPVPRSSLSFSNLKDLKLHAASLGRISILLSQIRLPAIIDFTAIIDDYPSADELASFMGGIQTSNVGATMGDLSLYQLSPPRNLVRAHVHRFSLADFLPCTAFSHLRRIYVSIERNVALTDDDLAVLATAWPRLTIFEINTKWGWNTHGLGGGGITPSGLLRLLQTCRSLHRVVLAMDVRDYTGFPAVGAQLGATFPSHVFLNVLDTIIEADAVPAVAAFFAGIVTHCRFSLHAWAGSEMVRPPGWEVYKDRWDDVSKRAVETVTPSFRLSYYVPRT